MLRMKSKLPEDISRPTDIQTQSKLPQRDVKVVDDICPIVNNYFSPGVFVSVFYLVLYITDYLKKIAIVVFAADN